MQLAGAVLDSSGGVLDQGSTLEESKLHSGDTLTLQVRSVDSVLKMVPQIQSFSHAFAAIVADGSVTWGGPTEGGEGSAVQAELKDVQQIQASEWAFVPKASGSKFRSKLLAICSRCLEVGTVACVLLLVCASVSASDSASLLVVANCCDEELYFNEFALHGTSHAARYLRGQAQIVVAKGLHQNEPIMIP